ncbi:fatty acyl-AMP ligase [Pendulispora albinea]|uniref:Fatty acyl-AMP ligase n=1 Tax=Pendulispora albinea TaxID=2741071 RepID=A0ABZ2M0J5_9BACT
MAGFGEVLHRWALECPGDVAFTFLGARDGEDICWTYGELDRRARRIAAALAPFDGSVLLIQPTGPEFVEALFGCLYAGRPAIPTYPPHPLNPRPTLQRLRKIVADARPGVVAVSAHLAAAVDSLRDDIPELAHTPRIVSDRVIGSSPETEHDGPSLSAPNPDVGPDDLAVLQYTSGSTGDPRGVMLTHGNLLANTAFIGRGFELTRASRAVTWLPPYHDMGLIGGLLQPVLAGLPCTVLATLDFLKRPVRWLQAIAQTKATISGGPNFAYELCANRIKEEDSRDLDLRSWILAYNASEPINPAVLQRFAERFRDNGFRPEAFYPCYGLAESTLAVTLDRVGRPPVVEKVDRGALSEGRFVRAGAHARGEALLVSSGRADPEHECIVVDPESLRPVASGAVGEIWARGPSVALGYLNREEETRTTFGARLATGEGPFLRTGDLGAMIDGELFITGRIKDVIILRGRNHAPQDIEAAVASSHPILRPSGGAAFAVQEQGEERLIIVQEVESAKALDTTAVMRAIRRAVAAVSDLQPTAIVLIRWGQLPKTTSGKVQRQACRSMFVQGTLEAVAEWRSPRVPLLSSSSSSASSSSASSSSASSSSASAGPRDERGEGEARWAHRSVAVEALDNAAEGGGP